MGKTLVRWGGAEAINFLFYFPFITRMKIKQKDDRHAPEASGEDNYNTIYWAHGNK